MTARHNDAPDCAGRNVAQDHGKHTPGPWVIDPCWDILGNTDDGNGMVCQITTDAVPRAEAEANARLIAAAPDLLEACRQALGCDLDPNTIALIRAAIARATGAA